MAKTKKVCYVPWMGTPKQDKIFNENNDNWEFALKERLEKKNVEIHTNDVLDVEEADYCLFFDNIFYQNLDVMWKLYDKKILDKSVYIDYEPPTGHCKNHDHEGIKQLSKIFKCVITYDDDLVDGKRIIKGNIANFYTPEIKKGTKFNDKKLLVMVTNCVSRKNIINLLNISNMSSYYNKFNIKEHPKAIYSKRFEAAEYFLNKCPEDFDLYGNNWPKKFAPVLRGPVGKKEKCSVLNKYKFAISYDSYYNQNGYVSEKIFDCFRAKVVPVYWGANNVTKYIPSECFIDRRDFNSYDELYDFLLNIDEEKYNGYIKAIEEFLQSDTYKEYFSSEASAKILEKALLTKVDNYSYEEAYDALMYFENKRREVDKKKQISCFMPEFSKDGKIVHITFPIELYGSDIENKITPYIDGKKVKWDKIVDNNRREFTLILKYVDKPIGIQIRYNSSTKSFWLPIKHDFATGLYYTKKRTQLNYYNMIGETNPLKKVMFILAHNKIKALRFIKRKLLRENKEN